MNNKIAIGLLLALVVTASGCASQTDTEKLPSPEKVDGNVEKEIDVEGAGTIRKVTIDGDICYLYDWGNAGGLSCVS